MALEPRFMYDAAGAATLADHLDHQAEAHAADHVNALADHGAPPASDSGDHTPPSDHAVPEKSEAASTATYTEVRAADPSLDGGKKEVVFIESDVSNYETLVASVRAGVEIVVLDSSGDGLAQIAAWASTHSGYDTISIISHGNEGQVSLGTLTLDSTTSGGRSADLAAIGAALTSDGDLLLYTCDLAAGSGGILVQQLADKTGADVAASTDETGAAAKGGDWVLETTVGDVTAASPFDSALIAEYTGILSDATFTFGDSDSGSMNVTKADSSNAITTDLTETIGSDTLHITSTLDGGASGNLWWGSLDYVTSSLGDIVSGDTSSWAGSWGTGDETVKTVSLTVDGGKHFDLNSLTILAVDAAGHSGTTFTIVVTNNSGYSQQFTLTSYTAQTLTLDSHFDDTSSVTITCLDSSSTATTFTFLLDNIALTNIYTPETNAAPVLDATKSPTLTTESQSTATSTPTGAVGTLVSSLVDIGGTLGNVTDSNTYPVPTTGIAITDLDSTNGTWYYTTDSGTTWTAVGAVSETSALLLKADANTRLYFKANSGYSGSISDAVTFRAWDTTSGTAGSKVDTTTNGGTSAFSTATDTASLTVTDDVAPTSSVTTESIQTGTDVTARSTETGTIYLVSDAVTVTDLASLTTAVTAGTAKSATVGSANTDTTIATAGLAAGTYHVYAVDAAGNVSAISSNSVTVDNTAPTASVTAAAVNASSGVTTAQSTETGTVYLVSSSVTVTDKSSLDSAVTAGTSKSATVTSANTNTSVVTSGLADGTYYLYAVDAAGNVSVASSDAIVIDSTTPSITLTGGSVPYTENDGATVIDSGATVTETGSAGGSVLTVGISAYALSSDQLSFATGTNSGINVSGTTLRSGTTVIGTVSAASVTGGTTLTVTFSATATAQDIANTIAALRYLSTSDNPTASSSSTRTITFDLTDGAGNAATAQSRTVAITAVNDAPTNIVIDNAGVSHYDSDSTVVGSLSATDADNSAWVHTITSITLPPNGTVITDAATIATYFTLETSGSVASTILRATSPSSLTVGTYSVTIEVDDGSGEHATYSKSLAITVTNTLTVTTATDEAYVDGETYSAAVNGGSGLSLCEAIGIAEANGGATIQFASGISSMTIAEAVSITENITLDTSNNSALTLNLTGGFTISSGKTLTITNTASESVTVTGGIGGDGSLVKSGAGTLTLSGSSSSYAGGTTISGGTLEAASSSALGAGTITINGGALKVDGAVSLANAITLGGSDNTVTVASGTATLTGLISGDGHTLTKTGSGTLVLSGTNSFSGGLAIDAGTLSLSNAGGIGSGNVTVGNGAVLAVTADATLANAISLAGTAKIGVASGVTLTLSGAVTGSGSLDAVDSGTLVLSGTNSFSGGLAIDAGTVTIANAGAIVSSTAVTMASGARLTLGASLTVGSLSYATADATTVVDLGSYTLTVGNGASTTFGGKITGTGGLIKQGSGTLTLSGANTFTGTLTISAGTVALSGGSALADSAAVAVGSGTTLHLATSETIGALSGSGAVTLGATTLTLGDATSTTYSGSITGTASSGLVKAGSGTLTLSGTNGSTFLGTITVSAGTLAIGTDANLGTGTVTLAGGTTLSVGDATTIDEAISLTGDATLAHGNALTLASAISASGHILTKSGAGALTLTADSTVGTLAATGGSLMLRATVTGNVAIGDSSGTTTATLSGTGTVTGTTLIGKNSTLSPGIAGTNNGIGTLTLASLQLYGTLAIEIVGDGSYDRVVTSSGSLTLYGTSALTVTLVNGYSRNGATGITYTVISGLASTSGTLGGTYGDGSSLYFNSYSDGYTLNYAAVGGFTDLTLTGLDCATVSSVTSTTDDGTYGVGSSITIAVTLDRAVAVSSGATLTLTLNTGATATYSGISADGKTLYFSYTVGAGQATADLDCASTTALAVTSGTVRDQTTDLNAVLTLPSPAAANSLGANKAIVIGGDTASDTVHTIMEPTPLVTTVIVVPPSATASSGGGATNPDAGRLVTLSGIAGAGSADAGRSVTLASVAGSGSTDAGRSVTLASIGESGSPALGFSGGMTGVSGGGPALGGGLSLGGGSFGGLGGGLFGALLPGFGGGLFAGGSLGDVPPVVPGTPGSEGQNLENTEPQGASSDGEQTVGSGDGNPVAEANAVGAPVSGFAEQVAQARTAGGSALRAALARHSVPADRRAL
jgi:autotransporter-associated beta strand protein